MVSESAKETCLNWFYKIASIRELLPRLYVEMSIIKCYNFIDSSAHKEALMRIAKMIRGIGDPLVAIYARCYLFRVGGAVTNDMEYMKESFIDFLDTYHTVRATPFFNTKIKTFQFTFLDLPYWNQIGNFKTKTRANNLFVLI